MTSVPHYFLTPTVLLPILLSVYSSVSVSLFLSCTLPRLLLRPKLTVVVVKKRISARFFAHIDGKLANPPPGTVIDTEVTRPEWYVH